MKQILIAMLFFATHTLAAQCPEPKSKELRFNLNDSLIEQEMSEISQQMTVPIQYNSKVKNFISMYVNYRYDQTQGMFRRSCVYFPIIEKALHQHGLPDELKYYAMVASAMNPKATSRDGKKGLWQLSPTMAKQFNLIVKDDKDERLDVERSTEAACARLEKLYAYYRNWQLVLSAFDLGTACVDKAIAAADGSQDYWVIRKHLPLEAQGSVPAYIAILYIMTHPENYEFSMETGKE